MMRNVLKVANPDITPKKIAARAFSEDPNGNVNIAGKNLVIKAAIEDWVGKCQYYTRAFTWEEVKTSIDNNKPILVGYGWSTGGGHTMVVGGYEPKGTGDWGLVRLFDPLLTGHTDISHDRLFKGNYDDENWPGLEKGHAWDATWSLL